MKFISNSEIKSILVILNDPKFEERNKLDEIKLEGKIIPYEVSLNYIKSIDGENRETIKKNIESYLEDHKNDIDENLARIMNYVLLDIPRVDELESFKHSAGEVRKNLTELRMEIRDVEKKRKAHEEKIEKIQGDFISILSIFSAVIIAFFGGLNIVSSALANMHNVTKYRLVLTLLIIGIIMFNVIYMLLNEIYKLTNRNMIKGVQKCDSCENKIHTKCFVTKHAMLFYYNLISIILIGLVVLAYMTDKYNIIIYIINILNYIVKYLKINIILGIEFIPIIGIIGASIIFMCIVIFIKNIMFNNTCQNEYESNDRQSSSSSLESIIDNF